jgi:anti-sigma factor RsiW
MSRIRCGEDEELLLRYAAGKLDAESRAALETRLAGCQECREFVAAQSAVARALDAWEAPAVSTGFDRALYRRIERETKWWERIFPRAAWRRSLPVAGAACLVLMAVIIANRPAAVESPAPYQAGQLRADQVERAVDDLALIEEFDGLVRPEAEDSRL